jgi:hypothetical protein
MTDFRAAFTVNLLHDRARPAADLFASGKHDRFDQIAWRHDDAAGGAPPRARNTWTN